MKKIFCLTILLLVFLFPFSSLYSSFLDSIWTSIAIPTNTPDRVTHGSVYDSVGDKIYLLGGSLDGQAGSNVNLCQEYDPVSNSWMDKAPMPNAIRWIQGSLVRRKIYIIGGYSNSSVVLNENLEYDIIANAWVMKASTPHRRCSALEAVWRDSLIYVMGGTNLTIGLTNVDIYNSFTNTWMPGTDLPEPAEMGDAVIINDTIYILGAFNRGTSTPWTNLVKGAINPNNPNQITWFNGPTLPDNSLNVAATVIGDKIYWLGGETGEVTATWYYTIGSDTIYPFVSYPIVVSRTQMIARTSGNLRELYVLAGDSGNNWVPPNRTYMKFTFDVGVNEIIPIYANASYTVKSNPAKSFLTVRILNTADRQLLKICDVSGKMIKEIATSATQTRNDGEAVISLKGINPGIYFLRVSKETKKFLVVK